jgi:hypothetical protein
MEKFLFWQGLLWYYTGLELLLELGITMPKEIHGFGEYSLLLCASLCCTYRLLWWRLGYMVNRFGRRK